MRSNFFYILLISTLISSASATAQVETLGFEITNEQKRVRIPFELHNNLIVIPVLLNNQLPLRFILDTGVRTAILTQKAYTDILNLPYSKKYVISGIGEDADVIEAYVTNDVSLGLPGIAGKGHAMLVLEQDYLQLRNYLGTEVHGILGYEIFSRFVVKIDYDNKVLILTTPEYLRPHRRYERIPIKIEDTKPYIVGEVEFEKDYPIPVKLLIDTGASHGLMLDEDSKKELHLPEKTVRCNLGRGLSGDLHGQIGRLKKFTIGNKSWNSILATFPDTDVLDSLLEGSVYRNGSIGGEILSRFKVIIDFPNEQIYLKKGVRFKNGFNYNLSGLVVKAKGSRLDTYEIVEVMEDSAGDRAGLKEGDIIISINHIDHRLLRLENITGILNFKENKKIKIDVLRNDSIFSTKFKLKSQI